MFVGRTDDDEAQADALRLLKVPTGVGYEQMLGTLSPRPRHDDRPDDTPRQFIFADGHGGVEKIRIDLEGPHLEHVREALDTNPDASRISRRGVVPAAPAPRPARRALSPPTSPHPPASTCRRPRPCASRARRGPPTNRVVQRARRPGRTVDDLDDPEGLRAAGVPPTAPPPELLDDEELDLPRDVDDAVPRPRRRRSTATSIDRAPAAAHRPAFRTGTVDGNGGPAGTATATSGRRPRPARAAGGSGR